MSDNIKFIATVCSSVIGVSLGLFGIGYAIGSRKKMNAVSDIVEKSVDDIFADGKVDIPKDLINETIKEQVTKNVEITVQRKVDEACDDAVLKVRTSIYNSIRESADKVVTETYDEMKPEAKESIHKKLRNIDIESLKREVKEEAKNVVSEKLEASTDDILEQFNANLSNMKTIYSSIAKTMSAAV